MRRGLRFAWVPAAVLLAVAPAAAAERYALVVSGANGEPRYVEQYAAWREALVAALRETLQFPAGHITILFDGGTDAQAATAAGVRQAIDRLRTKLRSDDLLLIVLIGHGTYDGLEAKFNLVGPDLSASEWAALLKPLPGLLVMVDSTAASFPYLERLAGPRRIVITATDSPAQRFDTVFPEYFIKALTDTGADLDKNHRVSVWEAFLSASLGVRRYYEQRGLLAPAPRTRSAVGATHRPVVAGSRFRSSAGASLPSTPAPARSSTARTPCRIPPVS